MTTYTLSSSIGKLILLGTILASGLAFMDSTVVNIAVPTIQSKLNANLSGIQWVVNGYTLMMGSLILLSGSMGDRYGRKKMFLYGIALFTIASFLCSLSQSITQLIIARFIQGIGAAMMIPGSLSIINSSFAEDTRGRVIGYWSGFASGIAALGPFLGGILVQTFGWHAIFYINIPIGILALYITWRYVPESHTIASKKLDFLGTMLILISLFGISYGLIQGPAVGFKNPIILSSLMLGFICAIAFIRVENTAKEPIMPLTLFKNPLVFGANLATLFLYFALSGLIFFFVLNLQQVQHYSPLWAGISLLPTILIITFLSAPAGSLADRIGPRKPMIVGPILVGIAMSLLALTGTKTNYFISYLPGLILFGLGMALVIAPLTKSALSVDERYSGVASGVNNAIARIAGLLAVSLLGAIMAGKFSSDLMYGMNQTNIPVNQRQMITTQAQKLGAIAIPQNFAPVEIAETKQVMENAFINSFHWIAGINAFLAFLSAAVSYFFINTKRNIKAT